MLDFAELMLADALPRKDQRAKGELYLRGLLTDGQRKSMQPMAQRLGVDHQGLQAVRHVFDVGLRGSAGSERDAVVSLLAQ